MNIISAIGGIKKAKKLLASWCQKPLNEDARVEDAKFTINGIIINKDNLREAIVDYYFSLVGGKDMAKAIIDSSIGFPTATHVDTLSKQLIVLEKDRTCKVWDKSTRKWVQAHNILQHNLVSLINLECALQ